MPHAYKTRNACKRGMARAGAVIQDDIPETVTVEESIEQVVGGYAGMFTFSEPVELSDPMIAKRFLHRRAYSRTPTPPTRRRRSR